MDARQLRYRLEYVVFCAILFFVRCLPVRSSIRVANTLAWFLHDVLPRKWTRYAVSSENIRTAFGGDVLEERVDQMTREMWQHLVRIVFEMIQMDRRLRLYNCTDVIEFRNRNPCVNAITSGRPVLLLGGHFGNWEVSVNTFGDFGFPMGVVARDLDNPWLHGWFKDVRESKGNWMISKAGASSDLVGIMENGECASLLGDQDAGKRGVFVDFFGKPASTFKSIALLALQHDAIICVGGTYRLPEDPESRWVQYNMTTEDVIDSRDFQTANAVPELTQRFTTAIENLVRRAPEQYFWVHRRWKTPPRKARKSKAA